MTLSRLALGTAQFGLKYGIANTTDRVSRDAAAAILENARASGLNTLDTAIAYGESEEVLGTIGIDGWEVISKLPPLPDGIADVDGWIDGQVRASLERLRKDKLSALLLHRPEQLHGPSGIKLLNGLLRQKERGLTDRIGISIYAPDELDRLPELDRMDIVQAPLNVLDQRMVETGWAARLEEMGVEFHARSVFLQGLLLMEPDERPAAFHRWDGLWRAWESAIAGQSISRLAACLRFALSVPQARRIVVGVDNVSHLRQILAAADGAPFVPPVWEETVGLDLINPGRWSQL